MKKKKKYKTQMVQVKVITFKIFTIKAILEKLMTLQRTKY